MAPDVMLEAWYSLHPGSDLEWLGRELDEEGWGKLSDDRLGWGAKKTEVKKSTNSSSKLKISAPHNQEELFTGAVPEPAGCRWVAEEL